MATPTNSTTRLSESTNVATAMRVDREAGILRDVKLLGFVSRNTADCLGGCETMEWGEAAHAPYHYSESAAKNVLSYYERLPIYEDHWPHETDRPIRTVLGEVRGPYLRADGIYAQEVHIMTTHGAAASIFEMAERFPNRMGMSHVAAGTIDLVEGRVTVVDWRPESVDLVSSPATTGGLFESARNTMKKKTVRQVIEGSKKSSLLRILREMEEANPELSAVAEEEIAPADPAEELKAAIMSMLTARLETATPAELEALLEALGVEDSITAALGGNESPPDAPAEEAPAEDAPAEEPEEEPAAPAFESLQRRNRELELRLLLTESGRKATDVRIKALLGMDSDSVQELIESWPQDVNGNGRHRPLSSPPLGADDNEVSRFAALLKQ